MLKMHNSFSVSVWRMKYASIAAASLSWKGFVRVHGLVILTPISFHVVLVPVGKTCVNVKSSFISFYIQILLKPVMCPSCICTWRIAWRVRWWQQVRTQAKFGALASQSYSSCLHGLPGLQANYRSQHRQLEGAKCVAISCLSKRMSLLSYDSILLDSTAYHSDTHCIHHTARCHFLITILFSISVGGTA